MARQLKNPFHPGEILLEEFLAPGGMTQAASMRNVAPAWRQLSSLHSGFGHLYLPRSHGQTAGPAVVG